MVSASKSMRRKETVMTIALALLSLMIVMLFSGLVLGALRQELPHKRAEPVWIRNDQA